MNAHVAFVCGIREDLLNGTGPMFADVEQPQLSFSEDELP